MKDQNHRNFASHFKMPKAEINRIRKDYKESQAPVAENEKNIGYPQMAEVVLRFFEEISGRKSNDKLMNPHLFYWFDEGFQPPEMVDYIRQSFNENYFKENPHQFRIAMLFPIRDEDRILATWDKLSYFFSLKNKKEKRTAGLQIKYQCGHQRSVEDVRKDPTCYECLSEKNLIEVIKSPYAALRLFQVHSESGTEVDVDLASIALWFCRDPEKDKSLEDYASRTFPMRKEIYSRYGIHLTSELTIKKILQKMAS
jgi:hypothetical protein